MVFVFSLMPLNGQRSDAQDCSTGEMPEVGQPQSHTVLYSTAPYFTQEHHAGDRETKEQLVSFPHVGQKIGAVERKRSCCAEGGARRFFQRRCFAVFNGRKRTEEHGRVQIVQVAQTHQRHGGVVEEQERRVETVRVAHVGRRNEDDARAFEIKRFRVFQRRPRRNEEEQRAYTVEPVPHSLFFFAVYLFIFCFFEKKVAIKARTKTTM